MALQSTTAIATITLQQASSTVTFSGIPDTYRDLVLVISGVVSAGGGEVVRVAFNSDTTSANYPVVFADGNGSSPSSGTDTTNRRFGLIYPSQTVVINNIIDYSATDKHKTFLTRASGASNVVAMNAGRWANTAAIASIQVETAANAFASETTFSLYGRIA